MHGRYLSKSDEIAASANNVPLLPGEVAINSTILPWRFFSLQNLMLSILLGQSYGVGDVVFSKYSIPTDILTCEKPLLVEPLEDEAMSKKNAFRRERMGNQKKDLNPKMHKRNVFSTCAMTSIVNEAALFFKKHHCKPEETNKERSIT